jgi:hypothetical protein
VNHVGYQWRTRLQRSVAAVILLMSGALLIGVTAASAAQRGVVAHSANTGTRTAHDNGIGLCSYANTDGAYKVTSPEWACGAVLSGPSSLSLGPCPSSLPGPYGTPLTTVLSAYLCTPSFTLSLGVTATATGRYEGTPRIGGYNTNGTQILNPGWCTTDGPCSMTQSVPERILVLKGRSPQTELVYGQGFGNCPPGTFTCDYQVKLSITLGGAAPKSLTGTISYDYADGSYFASGAPYANKSQVTPARDIEVEILDASKTSCSTSVLSYVYTSDTGTYTSAMLPSGQKHVCVKILAATNYSEVIPYSRQTRAAAANGTLASDNSDAYATKALGPKRLAGSGATTFNWKPTGVNDPIDQALDVANAVLTGAQWLVLYGLTPKFTHILYPTPASVVTTSFTPSKDLANINQDDAFDWGVLLHEYGHFVAAFLSIDNTTSVKTSQHLFTDNLTNTEANKSQGLAISWNEGFADFFSQMVQRAMDTASLGLDDVGANPPIYIDQLPHTTSTLRLDVAGDDPGGESYGEDNEASVARVLWAIYQKDYATPSGSVAMVRLLVSVMPLNDDRDLSHAVDALLTQHGAAPWVPDVGASSTNATAPSSVDESTSATIYGRILSIQNVAPTIVKSDVASSGSSIDVSWRAGQPTYADDQSNVFLVQFWSSSWKTLLTEQVVTDRPTPLVSSEGSEVYDATQLIPESWKKSDVNIVVLGWNTLSAPDGLTVSGGTGSLLPFGLNPLTGPYISAPATVPVG